MTNSVFSFISNTAEIAFFGMMESFEVYLEEQKKDLIMDLPDLSKEALEYVFALRIRKEKIAINSML